MCEYMYIVGHDGMGGGEGSSLSIIDWGVLRGVYGFMLISANK